MNVFIRPPYTFVQALQTLILDSLSQTQSIAEILVSIKKDSYFFSSKKSRFTF